MQKPVISGSVAATKEIDTIGLVCVCVHCGDLLMPDVFQKKGHGSNVTRRIDAGRLRDRASLDLVTAFSSSR